MKKPLKFKLNKMQKKFQDSRKKKRVPVCVPQLPLFFLVLSSPSSSPQCVLCKKAQLFEREDFLYEKKKKEIDEFGVSPTHPHASFSYPHQSFFYIYILFYLASFSKVLTIDEVIGGRILMILSQSVAQTNPNLNPILQQYPP